MCWRTLYGFIGRPGLSAFPVSSLSPRPSRQNCSKLRSRSFRLPPSESFRRSLYYSWSAVTPPRQTSLVCQARGASSSLENFRNFTQNIAKSISSFFKKAYIAFLLNGWIRLTTLITFILALLTVFCNTWLRGYFNTRLLPETRQQLIAITERDVSLGKVNWVLPTGLIGVSPLVSVGPVEVGPGSAEKSQVSVPELKIGLDLIRTLFQRQIVFNAFCNETEIRVVQADNFSWFGRPLDTTPSSSNFCPGLGRQEFSESGETEFDPGSFMGNQVEEELLNKVKQGTEKSTKKRISERKNSQYSCSTSQSRVSGRAMVASMSTDLSNEDKGKGKVVKKDNGRTARVLKRMQLSKAPKETSHGVVMKHTIKEKPKGEILKPRRQGEIRRKKMENQQTEEPVVISKETKSEVKVESPPSVLTAEQPSTSVENPATPEEPKTEEEAKETSVSAEEDESSFSDEKEVSMEEVKSWISAAWRHFSKNFKFPSVSVGSLHFNRSTILAFVTGEEIPRELVNVRARVVLSRGYHNLLVELQADAHQRNPDSVKSTKLSPFAPKHLRFVTPGASTPYDRIFPGDILPNIEPVGEILEAPASNEAVEEGVFEVKYTPRKPQPSPNRKIRQVVPESKVRTEGAPQGGSVNINFRGKNLFREDCCGDIGVEIAAHRLHAPVLERLLEIPVDIHDGQVDGKVYVKADSPKTWQFPLINGKLKFKDVDMHFWDSPDHLSSSSFETLFENNRLYFHEASGYYGTLPIVISGDMDVDPDFGQYRLTGVISPVEINVARATFGIRPMPNPIAGAVRGIVHCCGPLREPVFSGSVNIIRPTPLMIDSMEDSNAKTALTLQPSAVGAFDKVPFQTGRLLFTHDMGSDVLTLHDFAAQPLAGGKVRGRGQMWVAPAAEQDPKALQLRGEAHGVPASDLLQHYLPEKFDLPKVLDAGATNAKLTMKGSHSSPITEIAWESPEVQAEGEAYLSRKQWSLSAKAPSFEFSGTLHTHFLPFEQSKSIYSQSEMTKMCAPKVTGIDSDIHLKGCDMLPLFSNTYPRSRTKSGQAMRLKLSGKTQIKAQQLNPEIPDQEPVFQGDVSLQGLRMNQLDLAKELNGDLQVSSSGVSLNAKGIQSEELLNFNINLKESGDWLSQDISTTGVQEVEENQEKTDQQTEGVKGARFSLKQGKLYVSSQLNRSTHQVQMQIRGLTLDELELGSLRGDLQELSLDLNFLKKEGRGEVHVITPRYSGLHGEVLSGGLRWERDVLRLEKMILQQKASRYEVQGEYSIPANVVRNEGESGPNWLPEEVLVATSQPYIGRWRIQVNVPQADFQEILPAARLLSRAANVHERDYEKAREEFLKGLKEGGLKSPPLSDFVKSAKVGIKEKERRMESAELKSNSSSVLPGIQSLRGQWSGSLQAFGGGRGASTLNFNLKGESWKWGEYEVDDAVANGSYHSSEGAHLEEITLRTGDAHFTLRGDLLGPKQDASFVLNDFSAALLNPLYKAVPALQNAVPVVNDHTIGIKRLMDRWEKTKNSLGLSEGKEDNPMEKFTKNSPVNGLLFVRGTVGGSIDSPQGYLNLELYDGMIGHTQLSTASAKIALTPQQDIEFSLDSSPLESKGFLKVEGTLPYNQMYGIGDMDIGVRIKDGGMSLVAALIPEYKWETGSADIEFMIKGKISDPEMQGTAKVSRATLSIPNLKYPLKHTYGSVRVENGKLLVDNFETKSGNHGHIKAKGGLPIFRKHISPGQEEDDELKTSISKLELKMNSTYNGRLDSTLKIKRCLKEPLISGDIELSRGIMVLQFGALSNTPTPSSTTIQSPLSSKFQDLQLPRFSAEELQPPRLNIPAQMPMEGVCLDKLRLVLGSELRFQVPFMVNLLLSGELEMTGPPQDLIPKGMIKIDGGMVNLLATQLTLDREDTPGTITFLPEQGFDPELDITLTSPAEGFKAICQGRASTWQENVILRFRGAQGTDEEQLSQAAKVFQTRLAAALGSEDGQIALVNLAASTMATMSPRLDTWGQIGAARWRIVSAPNISYLLTNSERLDFQDIVTTLLSGTEIEVQYGPTQAVLAHKMHGSSVGMHCSLSLNFTDNLKLTAGVMNTPSTTGTVLFQYNSEGRTRKK